MAAMTRDVGTEIPQETRWVIRDIGAGWFAIYDRGLDGKGHLEQLAKAFSLGRAEVVRDALEAAWPLETKAEVSE